MITASVRNSFLESLIAGEHKRCTEIVKHLINNKVPVFTIYEKLLKDAMYKVGELWEYNKISVATEHLASAIVESILNELYPLIISTGKTDKKVIVTCLEKEFHQIGSKMVADYFEAEGWEVLYLGANTPEKSLINYIQLIKPNLLAISVSIYFHMPQLISLIEKILKNLPNQKIVVGGQALLHNQYDLFSNYNNVTYLKNLAEIEEYLSKELL